VRIAIVGAGKIGTTLGQIWAERGHEVVYTFSRDPAVLAERAAAAGGTAAEPADAVRGAGAVLLSAPGSLVPDAVEALGPLDGVPLIDATNYGPGAAGIAELVPGAHVVKAVNTVFQSVFPKAAADPGGASMLFCGDDEAAKETVAGLISDLGLEPWDAGGLDQAGRLESFAELVISMAYQHGFGPFAYRLIPVDDL
jgi:8-hydroxy-5-deazaflavin:NADPH oxidoreductase